MSERIENLVRVIGEAKTEVGKVIVGQQDVIDQALMVILVGQHALIEGVPGIAKTLLVRTLARVLGCEYSRIQFTPDLMPSDITGTNVFNMKENTFALVKGPVFTTFLLADEINRAPAKTQSALLQAMQERKVTIDQETYSLSANFTVFATQNPIEYEGTYALPEAQKDRFVIKINMDVPSEEEELQLAHRFLGSEAPEVVFERGDVRPVLQEDALASIRPALGDVVMRDELVQYGVELVRQTRTSDYILVGSGPRATKALLLMSRVAAVMAGRDYVTPDDIKIMVMPVLQHRLILRPEYELEGMNIAEVVDRLLQDVVVPR